MRPEIEEKLMHLWLTNGDSYSDYIATLAKLDINKEERQELAKLVVTSKDEELVGAWLGLMEIQPDDVYFPALLECLETGVNFKAWGAIRSLIGGHYPGALEAIFASDRGLKAAGDNLPDEITRKFGELTPEMQQKLARMFCLRFVDFPKRYVTDDGKEFIACLLAQHSPWFHALAAISYTDEHVEKTLLWISKNLVYTSQDEYLLLLAMAANPRPAYMKFFKKYSKSRIIDLREPALEGLAKLKEMEGK